MTDYGWESVFERLEQEEVVGLTFVAELAEEVFDIRSREIIQRLEAESGIFRYASGVELCTWKGDGTLRIFRLKIALGLCFPWAMSAYNFRGMLDFRSCYFLGCSLDLRHCIPRKARAANNSAWSLSPDTTPSNARQGFSMNAGGLYAPSTLLLSTSIPLVPAFRIARTSLSLLALPVTKAIRAETRY